MNCTPKFLGGAFFLLLIIASVLVVVVILFIASVLVVVIAYCRRIGSLVSAGVLVYWLVPVGGLLLVYGLLPVYGGVSSATFNSVPFNSVAESAAAARLEI